MQGSAELEAQIFTKYLVKKPATPAVIVLYKQAVRNGDIISKNDRKLLTFMVQHPRLVSLVDAGLVLYRPQSEARRRAYLMLAILEASPDYYDDFLPKQRSFIYPLFIGYSGLRAVAKSLFGVVLVRVVAR